MPSSNNVALLKAIELYEKQMNERYETLLRMNKEYFHTIDRLMAESLKKKELALMSLCNARVNQS